LSKGSWCWAEKGANRASAGESETGCCTYQESPKQSPEAASLEGSSRGERDPKVVKDKILYESENFHFSKLTISDSFWTTQHQIFK
jgi:hypothetical protein